MSVYSNEIDLEVLKYAVEHYSVDLPNESREDLLRALQNLQQQQPNAASQLCELVSQTRELDQIYTLALRDLRRSYQTQERAKSATLTANSGGMLNGLGSIVDDLAGTLRRIQSQAKTNQTKAEQLAILRALDTHSLTLKDLTYRTGLSLPTLETLVTDLRVKGYVDLLSAPLLHWVFPRLKPMRDRQKPLAEDDYLYLTSRGYFRLHPIIQIARGNE